MKYVIKFRVFDKNIMFFSIFIIVLKIIYNFMFFRRKKIKEKECNNVIYIN